MVTHKCYSLFTSCSGTKRNGSKCMHYTPHHTTIAVTHTSREHQVPLPYITWAVLYTNCHHPYITRKSTSVTAHYVSSFLGMLLNTFPRYRTFSMKITYHRKAERESCVLRAGQRRGLCNIRREVEARLKGAGWCVYNII